MVRSSKELEGEIERLEKLGKTKEQQIYKIGERIERLRNTLSKARHKEELKREGVTVTIAKCERDYTGRMYIFSITTTEGLTWGQSTPLKIGKKHKITRRFYEKLKFQKRKKDLGKKRGVEKWWEISDEEVEKLPKSVRYV